MENDVLKNKIAPWQEKGRWYHMHVNENGMDINNSDEYIINNVSIEPTSGNVTLNDTTHVITDYVAKTKGATSSNRIYNKTFYYTKDKKTIISIPAYKFFATADIDVWLFIE